MKIELNCLPIHRFAVDIMFFDFTQFLTQLIFVRKAAQTKISHSSTTCTHHMFWPYSGFDYCNQICTSKVTKRLF